MTVGESCAMLDDFDCPEDTSDPSGSSVADMVGYCAEAPGQAQATCNFYAACVALFTVASLLCGTATNVWQLVFYRVIQGFGGGALQPTAQAILFESYPPEKRANAMAIFGLGAMVGPALGPTGAHLRGSAFQVGSCDGRVARSASALSVRPRPPT